MANKQRLQTWYNSANHNESQVTHVRGGEICQQHSIAGLADLVDEETLACVRIVGRKVRHLVELDPLLRQEKSIGKRCISIVAPEIEMANLIDNVVVPSLGY